MDTTSPLFTSSSCFSPLQLHPAALATGCWHWFWGAIFPLHKVMGYFAVQLEVAQARNPNGKKKKPNNLFFFPRFNTTRSNFRHLLSPLISMWGHKPWITVAQALLSELPANCWLLRLWCPAFGKSAHRAPGQPVKPKKSVRQHIAESRPNFTAYQWLYW